MYRYEAEEAIAKAKKDMADSQDWLKAELRQELDTLEAGIASNAEDIAQIGEQLNRLTSLLTGQAGLQDHGQLCLQLEQSADGGTMR